MAQRHGQDPSSAYIVLTEQFRSPAYSNSLSSLYTFSRIDSCPAGPYTRYARAEELRLPEEEVAAVWQIRFFREKKSA